MHLSWTASKTRGIYAIRARVTHGCRSDRSAITSLALESEMPKISVYSIYRLTMPMTVEKKDVRKIQDIKRIHIEEGILVC